MRGSEAGSKSKPGEDRPVESSYSSTSSNVPTRNELIIPGRLERNPRSRNTISHAIT